MKFPSINLQILRYFDKITIRNVFILLVISVIFIMICLVPAVKHNKDLSSKFSDLENNLIRSVRKINNFSKLNKEKLQAESFVNKYESRLIEEREKTRIIGDVSDLAKTCGVAIVSMRPRSYEHELPEGFTSFYKPLKYELKLESSYHNFGKFLNLLENFDVILNIEHLNIKHNEENENIHLITIFLTTYGKVH